MSAGRAALSQGKARLLADDAEAATRSFAEAEDSFSSAVDRISDPWVRAVGWIPLVGRTPDAVSAIVRAGRQAAAAAHDLSQAIDRTPGGLGSLTPEEGRVRLARFRPLTEAVRDADRRIEHALSIVARAPDSLLIGPVGTARRLAEDQLTDAHVTLHTASLMLQGLPRFLGDAEPSRYFLAPGNPAEARGSGGFIGAFAIVTIRDGRLTVSDVRAVQDLPALSPSEVPAPNEDYARIYNPDRNGDGFWLNVNSTPDFPSAAQAILSSYEAVTGQRLDGVITADPFALAALLKVTGPTRVPGQDIRLDAGNVVDFTTNRAYTLFPFREERKVILGTVAKGVFEGFIAQSAPTTQGARVVARAAAEGHILIYSDDPTMEAALARTGAGGALSAAPGDFLSVVQNSGSGTKVDYYLDRAVTYSVQLGHAGTAEATASIRLDNHAPRSGQPRDVIGPFREKGQGAPTPGANVPIINLYCGDGCERSGAPRIRGDGKALGNDEELGHPFHRLAFVIPSEESAGVDLDLSLPRAWQGNSSGGAYHLTFLNQPTIRPTRLRVRVVVPDGMHVTEATEGMAVSADAAEFQGVPGRRLELDVTFQPSMPLRLWRNVVRFFSQPVFHF